MKRFWDKVDKSGDCWVWTAATNARGYGAFTNKNVTQLAHRFSYELANGYGSARGLMVCHRCDNPACVNPAHLFLGTNIDNVRDMQAKGRQSKHQRPRGEAHGGARLNEMRVLHIRAASEFGIKQERLASAFHISLSAINRIVNRHSWTHI